MRKLTTLLIVFLFSAAQLWAQNRTVTGKVTDENGSAKGTSTGPDGGFSLTVPPTVKSLTISGVGMATQNVSIPSSGNVSVKMSSASTVPDLDEVIVQVPYGNVKKTAFTGSEATVSSKQIERQQVTSITKTLEGLIPGISVSNGTGGPGSNASISIRGFGSLPGNGASTAPLYVVNGIVYDGAITSISNDDIETVTVLKDAAAASLYGSRAANGVIMITTKKGKKGKAQINLKLNQGFITRGVPEFSVLGAKEYYETYWEALKNSQQYGSNGFSSAKAGQFATDALVDNAGQGLVYNAYNVDSKKLVDPITGKLDPSAKLLWNDSWEKALFVQAQRQSVNLSISNASDKSDYAISMGYLKEDGLVKNSGFERYNLRLSTNAVANNWLSTGLNIDVAYTQRKDVSTSGGSSANPFYFTRNIAPIYPVWQRNKTTGAFVLDPTTGERIYDYGITSQMGNRPFNGSTNPVGIIGLDKDFTNRLNTGISTYVDVKFAKDFHFRSTLGGSMREDQRTQYQNPLHGNALNVNGRSTVSSDREFSMTFNQVLNWSKEFGKHQITALAGHESYMYKYNALSASKIGFQFNGFTGLDNGTDISSQPESYEDNQTIEGYFSKVSYSYNNKYLFDASVRTDGSSRFDPNVRWGKFYSISGAWRLSEEAFIKDISFINDLKLKMSYGSSGNEDLGVYYPYKNYQDANGVGGYKASSRLYNANLKWEANNMTNIGIDFALFNRRLQGSIEYFDRVSKDLLYDAPLGLSTTFTNQYQNIGKVSNKGIEIQLGYNLIQKKNFDWRVDVNFTKFKNKILDLTEELNKKGGFTSASGFRYSIGGSVYDYWRRESAGVDPSTGLEHFYVDVLDNTTKKATGERYLTDNPSLASFYIVGFWWINKFI
jgi:TonB-linked SusC/RagA family outer membrane protein